MAHFSLLERCKLFVAVAVFFTTVNGLYKTTAVASRVDEVSRQTVLITTRKYISFNIRNVGQVCSLNYLTSHANLSVHSAMILKREVCNQTMSSCYKHNLLRCTPCSYQTFPACSPLLLLKRNAGMLAISSKC